MAQQKRTSNATGKSAAKKRTTSPARSSTARAARSGSSQHAASAAGSARRSANDAAQSQAPRPQTPLLDRDARNQIAGVVLAVLGIASLVAVLTPSSGVVSQMVSDALHTAFGVGAFLVPLVLIVWSVTFFIGGLRVLPGRVAAGLAMVALAAIGLVGITTPNAEISTSILFNKFVLIDRGGAIGNGLAWVLMTLFGKGIGIIVLVGIIVCGLVLIGLNFKDALIDARDRHRARSESRRAAQASRATRISREYDRGARLARELPDDYAPTALFDPDRPLGSSEFSDERPEWEDMRPVTGNLYPDGSFVPLDARASQYLSMGQVPTTLLKRRGRSDEGTFGCGNTPRANSVQLDQVPTQLSNMDLESYEYDEDSFIASEGIDEDMGGAPFINDADDSARPDTRSTLLAGASTLAAKRAARKAQSASRWWDPADERRRDDFDPDALRLYPDRTLPGVLPGAPTAFEDLEDGFERIVEENIDVDASESPVTADYSAYEEALAAPVAEEEDREIGRSSRTAPQQAPRPSSGRGAKKSVIEYVEQPDKPQQGRAGVQVELPWNEPGSSNGEPGSGEKPVFRLPDPSVLQRGRRGLKKSPEQERETQEMARLLQNTLQEFGVKAEVVDWVDGPTFTTYEVNPGEGVRVNKFTSLEDDIARALAQSSVRIYAPVPGTRYVGIEVPNKSKQTVYFGDVLPSVNGGPLDFAIGLDANGKPVHADLAKLPHILIAGTTGSGKSVTVNTIVVSMLMRDTPDDVRLIMIDPKQVEFSGYNGIPHLIMPVVTDMKQAAAALQWGVTEMDRRYRLFSNVGVRELKSYNAQVDAGTFEESEFPLQHLPSIVIVIDELADLMMVAKKDVEASIVRIAQLGRACGIHLVMATQRPSADVVTGLIRANVANRIGLKVAKGTDSKVVIDQTGAEKLLGNGDMLFLQTSFGDKPRRIQGCWLSDDEISKVVEQLKVQQCDAYQYQMAPLPTGAAGAGGAASQQGSAQQSAGNDDEPLAWQAAQLVVENQLGSTSMVQRRLKLGYARAGRIMDMLEEMGVVGPARGSKPRDVLIRDLEELETLRGGFDDDGDDV